ncbi:N-6 DNA methylase [bacterium]|nr:MAG: N-6 DNA methylase [bacterium]
MLDQTTKRKLDSARQILVGKVPDPKAQVEQITTALVYKFMDDMDKESEELGGEAKFFANGFSQYAWTKLLDNKLSGQERLDLYVQAITNMSKNPHIPQLFRDIFKGAFLPYNDPRTLSLFLKEINEFNYEHSENLGNAFEYLLSILGSQGDAGQFRTPRHIIDFIVEVVDPKKNETILDPACGTAGFLISAYKHILKTNKEKPLTPDEKLKLMNNLAGYDISPDMVKLALVNMYLHGFPEPKIHEYDSLTSEKRWDETFDVIMANPPFMTPRGGVVPHKRFSIQANRAEVLFVDYIIEHLNISGRGGIVVPEGIMFQTSNANQSLRKKMVEDGLYAIVSLPVGIFNPYSATIKTSVLFFDNSISKKVKDILFINVEADGYDLGAKRQKIEKNDLPEALQVITDWKNGKKNPSKKVFWVSKDEILNHSEVSLNYKTYFQTDHRGKSKWESVKLGDICKIRTGKKNVNEGNPNGKYPFFTCAQNHTYSDVFSFDAEAILIAGNGDVGTVTYFKGKFEAYQRTYVLTDFVNIEPKYLYFVLKNTLKDSVLQQKLGNTMAYIKLGAIQNFSFPLPPMEVQKKIMKKIEERENQIKEYENSIHKLKEDIKVKIFSE